MMSEAMLKILRGQREHPEKLIPTYKDLLPGVTDTEALELIKAFNRIFESGEADFTKRSKEYNKLLTAAKKKYPGGKLPEFEFPNFPLWDNP